jgi:class 3 adenylate cyclase
VATTPTVTVVFTDLSRALDMRVGLSHGEATRQDGDYFGDPVGHFAAAAAR